jgi:hypothetical protein
MGIRKVVGVLIVIVFAAFWVGCGGSTSGNNDNNDNNNDDTSGMSEGNATVLSSQIAGTVLTGMGNINLSSSPAADTVGKASNCTTMDGHTTCTFDESVDYTVNCTAGGNMHTTGSLTGTLHDGTGLLQISETETISDWQCITGYIVNGDPYISLSGQFSFMNGAPSTQSEININGGFKWGTSADESCQIDISIQIDTTGGGGTMTGTVCGYSVDTTF